MKSKWYADEVKAGNGVTIAFGNSTVPGCLTVEARFKDCHQPIGTIWYAWAGKRCINILGCYVQDSFRRLGIMTRMHKGLLEAYPNLGFVITDSANSMSEPWLKRMGFKELKKDGWHLVVKP